MFRARASGFFVGFGVAGVLAAYTLRRDILSSHEVVLKQAEDYKNKLEKRVASLEASLSEVKTGLAASAAAAEAAAAAAAATPVDADE